MKVPFGQLPFGQLPFGQLPFERAERVPADTDLAVLRGMPHDQEPDDNDLDDLRGQCRSA